MRFITPAEIAGGRGRKHLWNGLLKLIGNGPVVVEEIPCLALGVPFAGTPCPFVVLAGMIHNKVQTDRDVPTVAVLGQRFQVLHRTELRFNPAEIGDGIAAIAPPLRALKDRHQMEIIHAAVFYVIQLIPDSVQRSGKGVDIHEHAEEIVPPVPVRILKPAPVELLQGRRPFLPCPAQHSGKIVPCALIAVIQLHISLAQFLTIEGKAFVEFRFPVVILHRLSSVDIKIQKL